MLLGTQALTGLSWLFLTFMLSWHLEISDVGIVLFFHSLSIFVGVLLTLGTGASALRFVSQARGRSDFAGAAQIVIQALSLMLVLVAAFLGLMTVLAVAGVSPLLSRFPGLPDWGVHAALWVGAVALRMNAFDLLIAQDRPGQASFHSGFGAAAMTAVALVAALMADVAITLKFVLTVATGAAIMSGVSAQINALRCARGDARGVAMGPPPGFVALVRVGLPIMFFKALSSRDKEIVVIILGAVASAEAVALVGVTNQILQVISMPMMAVSVLIQPQIARASGANALAEDMPRIRSLWSIALVPVVVIGLLAAVLAEPLAILAYGPGYAAVGVLIVVSLIGRLVTVAAGPAPQLLMMTGHERALVVFSLLEVGILSVLCLLLGKPYGALGGAWAFSISVGLMAILHVVYIRVRLGFWVFAWVFPSSLRQRQS